MRLITENRSLISFLLGAGIGGTLLLAHPFPADHSLLRLILAERPMIFYGLKWTYYAMLFSTPYAVVAVLMSFT